VLVPWATFCTPDVDNKQANPGGGSSTAACFIDDARVVGAVLMQAKLRRPFEIKMDGLVRTYRDFRETRPHAS